MLSLSVNFRVHTFNYTLIFDTYLFIIYQRCKIKNDGNNQSAAAIVQRIVELWLILKSVQKI
jgi:hypothetical protein